MKYYFEETGGGDGKIEISVYVKPKEEEMGFRAHTFDIYSKLSPFWWADPDNARVYESNELPRDMLYSIKHGTEIFEVPEEKADTWQLSDLEYKKIERKMVGNQRKAIKLLDDCHNAEDIYKVYSKYIEPTGLLTSEFVGRANQILSLPGMPFTSEIGFAGCMDALRFQSVMKEAEINIQNKQQ